MAVPEVPCSDPRCVDCRAERDRLRALLVRARPWVHGDMKLLIDINTALNDIGGSSAAGY